MMAWQTAFIALGTAWLSACTLIGYDELGQALSAGGGRAFGGSEASGGVGGSGGTATGGMGTGAELSPGGVEVTGGAGGRDSGGDSDSGVPTTPCSEGETLCDGTLFRSCEAGSWVDTSCDVDLEPCVEGVCDPLTGCSKRDRMDGQACLTDDLCLTGGQCALGDCVGMEPLDCSALDSICAVGRCSAETGACESLPVNFGVACGSDLLCNGGACLPIDLACGPGGSCSKTCEDESCALDCRAGNACEFDCTGGDCLQLCAGALACDMRCAEANSCALRCNPSAGCTGRCEDTAVCDFDCDGGGICGPLTCINSDCTFHCASAGSCSNVECLGESTCLLQCGSLPSTSCGFSKCSNSTDGFLDCGGGTYTCNRPCP